MKIIHDLQKIVLSFPEQSHETKTLAQTGLWPSLALLDKAWSGWWSWMQSQATPLSPPTTARQMKLTRRCCELSLVTILLIASKSASVRLWMIRCCKNFVCQQRGQKTQRQCLQRKRAEAGRKSCARILAKAMIFLVCTRKRVRKKGRSEYISTHVCVCFRVLC